MNSLARFRQSPRWLVLLIGFAALTVTTASLVPHDAGKSEDLDCLVCGAGRQPLTALSAVSLAQPLLALTAPTPGYRVMFTWVPVIGSGSPRAPPA